MTIPQYPFQEGSSLSASGINYRSLKAAQALKLTAEDLMQLGIIDESIGEPIGGAHRHPSKVIEAVGDAIDRALFDLRGLDGGTLRSNRREKFLAMGDRTL